MLPNVADIESKGEDYPGTLETSKFTFTAIRHSFEASTISRTLRGLGNI
jgi:hypothetical protein